MPREASKLQNLSFFQEKDQRSNIPQCPKKLVNYKLVTRLETQEKKSTIFILIIRFKLNLIVKDVSHKCF